jgi:hypothetical protein
MKVVESVRQGYPTDRRTYVVNLDDVLAAVEGEPATTWLRLSWSTFVNDHVAPSRHVTVTRTHRWNQRRCSEDAEVRAGSTR